VDFAHVGLVGNELVDGEARYASMNGSIFDRPLSPCDFQNLARPVLLREKKPYFQKFERPFCYKYLKNFSFWI
jgi:hypothetical protein